MTKPICELINSAIKDEDKAVKEYAEMLEVLPQGYENCSDNIIEIMEDERSHAVEFRNISKALECSGNPLSVHNMSMQPSYAGVIIAGTLVAVAAAVLYISLIEKEQT